MLKHCFNKILPRDTSGQAFGSFLFIKEKK